MTSALPLPRGFFDTTKGLSDEMQHQYIEFAESSIRKVLALSDSHKNSWIPVRGKKGIAVYRNFGHIRGPKAYKSNVAEICGKHDLHASLDEVAQAYAAHDDAMFRRLLRKLKPGTLDARVLFTVVPSSPFAPHRYVGIKWFATRTPAPLVAHRDYCCIDVQDKLTDAQGNSIFVRVLNSIEIPECPSLERSHGLVRARMLAGCLYRADPADASIVRAHHVLRFDPAGFFPAQWAFKLAESQLVNGLVQLARVLDKQQMNACTFVDKRHWVPNGDRKNCAVCARTFGTFRLRHHCRCCGEVICGKCSVFKSVEVPGTTLRHVRLCALCRMGAQKAGAEAAEAASLGGLSAAGTPMGLGDDMSDHSTASVTSSSTLAHNEMNLLDLYFSGALNRPSTPSGYSSTSTHSNLSIRSTASSRSVVDARAHGSFTRFFRTQPQIDPASASSAASSKPPLSQLNSPPRIRRGHSAAVRSLAGEMATSRSYIANTLTPHNIENIHDEGSTHGGFSLGLGLGLGVNIGLAEALPTPPGSTARTPSFKQAPLDIGYLRDTIRLPTGTQTSLEDDAQAAAEAVPETPRSQYEDADEGKPSATVSESPSLPPAIPITTIPSVQAA